MDKTAERNARAQGIGSVVSETNKKRLLELYESLNNIQIQDAAQRRELEQRLGEALGYIDAVRDFVGTPENILGNKLTKHGEIAEQVDVYFQNARNVIKGYDPVATFEGVGRTAPEDYKFIDGTLVQSKYINGSSKSLSAVLGHLEKYSGQGQGFDTGDSYFYVIPKDQYSQIQDVLSGNTTGLNARSIRSIKDKVQQIEEITQRPFSEAVKPGIVDYAEVQQGAIHKTLDEEVNRTHAEAANQEKNIERESTRKRNAANENAKPTWAEGAKIAGMAAAASGGMQLAVGLYRKCRQGKQISELSLDDWKELGIDTTKAATEGGISGFAIYGMTNFGDIPVPAASACVSLAFGIVELTAAYQNSDLTEEEFKAGCQIVCLYSVVCAVGSSLGNALIPVPILGPVIGSIIASNLLDEICGKGLNGAILNASYHTYSMTRVLQKQLPQIEFSIVQADLHITQAREIQKEIETDFDLFERLKER